MALNGLIADGIVFALGGSAKVDAKSRSAITTLEQIVQFEARNAQGGKALNLGDLDPYLKTYLYVRENPIALPLGVGIAVAALVGVGYLLGRG